MEEATSCLGKIPSLERENQHLKEQLGLVTTAHEKLQADYAHLSQVLQGAIESKTFQFSWDCIVPDLLDRQDGLLFARSGFKGGHMTWKAVPERWKSDPVIIADAIRAIRTTHISEDDIPEDLKQSNGEIALLCVKEYHRSADEFQCLQDRSFMKEHFEKGCIRWYELPTSMKTDLNFVVSIQNYPTLWCIVDIFEEFPQLKQERHMWEKVVETGRKRNEPEECAKLFDFHAPVTITSDQALMLQVCTMDARALEFIDEHLAEDHGFLLELAGQSDKLLRYLRHDLQMRFPDVVDGVLQYSKKIGNDRDYYEDLVRYSYLSPHFWTQRDFVVQWFQWGFPFVPQDLLLELTGDQEIFLLSAQHSNPEFLRQSFKYADKELVGNKDFMARVLEFAPYLFQFASPELRNDFDLCLLAFSGGREVAQEEVDHREFLGRVTYGSSDFTGQSKYVEIFHSQVSKCLQSHTIFSKIVLPAMALSSESGCSLAVLNQGAETSLAYKKRMAEFLDIPTGKKLKLHRKAASNITGCRGWNSSAQRKVRRQHRDS